MRRGAWCSLSSFHVAGAPIHWLPSLTRNGAEKIEVYSPGSAQGLKAMHKAGRSAQARLVRTMRGDSDPKDAENAEREGADDE